MALIGWGASEPMNFNLPGNGGFDAENEGSNLYDLPQGFYHCAVIGAFTTVVFTPSWVPVVADPSPVAGQNSLGGGVEQFDLHYDAPDYSLGTGTLTITALIDGVPAENELVVVTVANEYMYGNAAWTSTYVPPTPKFWTQFVGTEEP